LKKAFFPVFSWFLCFDLQSGTEHESVKIMCYFQTSHVPESDRSSLCVSRPCYADGVYLSEKCRPREGEQLLLQALSQRRNMSVHDAALAVSGSQAAAADNIEDFIRVIHLQPYSCRRVVVSGIHLSIWNISSEQ